MQTGMTTLALGSADCTASLWGLSDGGLKARLVGHAEAVTYVALLSEAQVSTHFLRAWTY